MSPTFLNCSIAVRIECVLFVLQILAHNAVHAAFAGYTGVTTGLVNTHYVLLPIPVVISTPRRVSHSAQALNTCRLGANMQ